MSRDDWACLLCYLTGLLMGLLLGHCMFGVH